MSFQLIQINELHEQSVSRRIIAGQVGANKPPSSAQVSLARPARKLIQFIVFTADVTCHLNSLEIGGKLARSRTQRLLHWLLNATNLLVLASLVCLCHIGASLYYQYLHNISAIRQNRLDTAAANGKRLLLTGTHSTNATLARLSRLIASTELEMSRIGTPLISDSLLLKCAIVVLATWTIAVYYPTVVFCSRDNLNSYYIRMVQSARIELLAMNRLIRTQLNTLLESSFNFTRKLTLEVLQMNRVEQLQAVSRAAPGPRQNPFLLRAWQNYLNTVEHSLNLFESGQLLEFFRPLKFYEKLYLFNVIYYVISIALICLLVLPSFLALTLNSNQLKLDLANPRNVLVWLELAFLTALNLDVFLFFGSVYIMTCLDQWRLVGKLKSSIVDSILANKLEFDRLLKRASQPAQPALLPTPKQQAMNERFLRVLIEYRLFRAHSMSINRLSNYITLMTLSVVTGVAVVGRVHAPYMGAHEKLLVIAFSVLFVALALIHLTPTCHFHERFKQLHRLLMSLMAHLVEAAELANTSGCKNAAALEVYDEHVVWLVREELSQPEYLSQRLTPRIFGTPVTYPNTLRLIFWSSLVIISNASEFHPENSTHLFSYLDDPLGILSVRNL